MSATSKECALRTDRNTIFIIQMFTIRNVYKKYSNYYSCSSSRSPNLDFDCNVHTYMCFLREQCAKKTYTIFFLYPAPLKSAGYYVIPSVQKFAFECPSVRPSVSASFQLSAGWIFKPIFFKLGMRVDIGKACPGIADG